MKQPRKVKKADKEGGLNGWKVAIQEPQVKPLTETEKEFVRLIQEEFLTPKQVQLRRKIKKSAFYKMLKSVKAKGALGIGGKQVDNSEALVHHSPPGLVRLHGQELNIRILYQDQGYQDVLKRANIIFLEGHTIKLYRNSIEIYAGPGISFYAEDEQRAFSKSLEYWKRFLVRLENELKVILSKPRSQNIKLVNQHFARGNSEIYQHSIDKAEKIKIFAEEDGKLAFLVDDSFGQGEDETVHPQTAKHDRKELDKHLNDWRLNHPPTNSELADNLKGLASTVSMHVQDTAEYAVHIKAHIESIQKLGAGVETQNEIFKKILKLLEERK